MIVANPRTGQVYVSEDARHQVAVINGRTNKLGPAITVPVRPFGIAVDTRTNTVYAGLRRTSAVAVINGQTDAVTGMITLPAGSRPLWLAMDPQTGTLYATAPLDAETGNAVLAINASTASVAATIDVPLEPVIAVNPRSGTPYVGSGDDNQLWAVSGRTDTVTAKVTAGPTLLGISVNPETGLIYAAQGDNTVSVISS
jgi:DNA-binding beta-propeller fold protein YncE